MRLYTYVCWGGTPGTAPFVKVTRTLEHCKMLAAAAVAYDPFDESEYDIEDNARPTRLEKLCNKSVVAIRAWDGKDELTVFHWDGGMEGYLTLTITELEDDGTTDELASDYNDPS